MRTWILFLIVFISFSCNSKQQNNDQQNSNDQYVVMLSMDGFRWDYPEKANTPNLDYIESMGVRADASIPCFPTKTFPNHYSMATGLYPDNHGIIQNSFYAPDLDKHYSIGNKKAVTNAEFYFGEPIWVTAEKQSVKTASYFWVGSEAPHDSIFPSYYYNYNGSISYEQRIDGVIDWLSLPDHERPRLIMWYFDQPDYLGHNVGPDHPDMIPMIEHLDSLVGIFMHKIANLSISDKINVIITSDHGMGAISKEKSVYLYEIIEKDWCKHIDGGNPVYAIEAKPEYYDSIYNRISSVQHLSIWKKEDVPDRLNFGSNDRIKDFVVVADSAWSIWKSPKRNSYSGGAHGYDNQNKDMHAIFYAYGPSFKNKYKHTSIHNIDLYPLICEILNLKPKKVDGDLENVIELLKK